MDGFGGRGSHTNQSRVPFGRCSRRVAPQDHEVAQGATVQDVSVRLGQDAFAGFGGAGGAGGSHVNVEVSGGRFGMYINESEPAPVVAAARFVGQSESAITFSDGAQPPLVLVGVEVEQPAGATGPALRSVSRENPSQTLIRLSGLESVCLD